MFAHFLTFFYYLLKNAKKHKNPTVQKQPPDTAVQPLLLRLHEQRRQPLLRLPLQSEASGPAHRRPAGGKLPEHRARLLAAGHAAEPGSCGGGTAHGATSLRRCRVVRAARKDRRQVSRRAAVEPHHVGLQEPAEGQGAAVRGH